MKNKITFFNGVLWVILSTSAANASEQVTCNKAQSPMVMHRPEEVKKPGIIESGWAGLKALFGNKSHKSIVEKDSTAAAAYPAKLEAYESHFSAEIERVKQNLLETEFLFEVSQKVEDYQQQILKAANESEKEKLTQKLHRALDRQKEANFGKLSKRFLGQERQHLIAMAMERFGFAEVFKTSAKIKFYRIHDLLRKDKLNQDSTQSILDVERELKHYLRAARLLQPSVTSVIASLHASAIDHPRLIQPIHDQLEKLISVSSEKLQMSGDEGAVLREIETRMPAIRALVAETVKVVERRKKENRFDVKEEITTVEAGALVDAFKMTLTDCFLLSGLNAKDLEAGGIKAGTVDVEVLMKNKDWWIYSVEKNKSFREFLYHEMQYFRRLNAKKDLLKQNPNALAYMRQRLTNDLAAFLVGAKSSGSPAGVSEIDTAISRLRVVRESLARTGGLKSQLSQDGVKGISPLDRENIAADTLKSEELLVTVLGLQLTPKIGSIPQAPEPPDMTLPQPKNDKVVVKVVEGKAEIEINEANNKKKAKLLKEYLDQIGDWRKKINSYKSQSYTFQKEVRNLQLTRQAQKAAMTARSNFLAYLSIRRPEVFTSPRQAEVVRNKFKTTQAQAEQKLMERDPNLHARVVKTSRESSAQMNQVTHSNDSFFHWMMYVHTGDFTWVIAPEFAKVNFIFSALTHSNHNHSLDLVRALGEVPRDALSARDQYDLELTRLSDQYKEQERQSREMSHAVGRMWIMESLMEPRNSMNVDQTSLLKGDTSLLTPETVETGFSQLTMSDLGQREIATPEIDFASLAKIEETIAFVERQMAEIDETVRQVESVVESVTEAVTETVQEIGGNVEISETGEIQIQSDENGKAVGFGVDDTAIGGGSTGGYEAPQETSFSSDPSPTNYGE